MGDCGWIKDSGITLILQPTTSADFLRRFLNANGFEIKSEKAVSENRKLYSVMAVNFSGNTTPKPEYFYYIGTLKPQTPEETMYIKKQQKILYNCIKSLENIPEKRECYEKYKSAFRGITEILTEYNNGI